MPVKTDAHPASPDGLFDHTTCHSAQFATRWLQPETAVISARGEVDAANSQEFVEYSLRHAAHISRLVVDLTGVEFFSTACFSALQNLGVRCADEGIVWAAVPSGSVKRVLRICDPDATLPVHAEIDAALVAVQGGTPADKPPLLQLVPEPS